MQIFADKNRKTEDICVLPIRPGFKAHAIYIALLWSAGNGCVAFYRHIAPLERKIEHYNFDAKAMDFQYLDLWVHSTSETGFGLTTAATVRLKRGVRHQILVE